MFDINATLSVGNVDVISTNNRGLSVEEIAKIAINKILYVAKDTPAPLRDQVLDFKLVLEEVILGHLKVAVDQDRATICAKLRDAGYPELAANLRSL